MPSRAFALGLLLLGACRSTEPAPSAEGALSTATLRATPAPARGGAGGSTPAPAARLEEAPAAGPVVRPIPGVLEPATSFLFGSPGGAVTLRSLDGQNRDVVPSLSSWLFDPNHGLLWFLDEDRLGVADLRESTPPLLLASGIPEVGALWVEWPRGNAAQSVRPETGCEESENAIELRLGSKPTLRLVESRRKPSLSRAGLRWLKQLGKRRESDAPAARGFAAGTRAVALPAGWQGCEDAERCGQSAAFGKGPLRLVLVRDDRGADCHHLGCLLFDPAAERFASPPLLVDAGGTASLAPQPPRWTNAKEATPGSCGPYRFDAAGSAFLAGQYLCRLDAEHESPRCEELPGESIGWVKGGQIAGSPG